MKLPLAFDEFAIEVFGTDSVFIRNLDTKPFSARILYYHTLEFESSYHLVLFDLAILFLDFNCTLDSPFPWLYNTISKPLFQYTIYTKFTK